MLMRQSEQRSEDQHEANHRTADPPSRMLTERVVMEYAYSNRMWSRSFVNVLEYT